VIVCGVVQAAAAGFLPLAAAAPLPGRLIVFGATGVVASLLALARVSSPRAGRSRAARLVEVS